MTAAVASPSKVTNISTSTHSSDTLSTAKSGGTATPHLKSATVHENMLQKHHRIDPMEFYTIESVLGEGSMGYVAKVLKKDSARGGSARPDFVVQHRHLHGHPRTICGWFPSWFSLCCNGDDRNQLPNMNGTFIDITNHSNATGSMDVSSLTSSGLHVSNPKVLEPTLSSLSTMITYGTKKKTHYALKSIIMDRCSTPEFKEELKNEGMFFVCFFRSLVYK
jgi:hypothetical protein